MAGPVVVSKSRSQARPSKAGNRTHEDFYNYYGPLSFGAFRVSRQGKILAANQAFLRMLGYDHLEEVQRYKLPELHTVSTLTWDQFCHQVEAYDQVRNLEAVWTCRDGSPVFTKLNAWTVRSGAGDDLFYEANMIDVTDRKAKEALHVFRLLFDTVPVGFAQLDLSGKILKTNRAFEDIMGVREPKLRGRVYGTLINSQDSKGLFKAVVEGNVDRYRRETQFERADGGSVWVIETASVLKDAHKTPRFINVVLVDITDQKHAEEHLLQRTAQLETANQELESFAHTVGHDLRTPLRAISSFSQMLAETQPTIDDQGVASLARILAATRRMSQLIDDLLMLSRITRAEIKKEPVDLSWIAHEVCADLQKKEPKRRATFVVRPGLMADADPRLIRIVLENLLGNAWKFTAKKKEAQIEFGVQELKDGPAFFVSDNGAGFNQAHATRLFQAFQRLHGVDEFEGTGIGLATVNRIVTRHGGRAWGEGRLNDGATFYFTVSGGKT